MAWIIMLNFGKLTLIEDRFQTGKSLFFRQVGGIYGFASLL